MNANIFSILTFITSLLCLTTTILAVQNNKYRKLSEVLFYVLFASVVWNSGFLLYNILVNNFQYSYIWEYSSKDLPFYLKISSFFAGQEGSFLLWNLLLLIIAIPFFRYSKKFEYDKIVKPIYLAFVLILSLLIMFKSPFQTLWDKFPNDVKPGFMPFDGHGLNPVLQNVWIAIHPPVLFLGYTLIFIPYVLALAGLIKKDYQGWAEIAYPWILLSSGILGAGLILGGIWAYETLGWGGWWGWDPVENSSLIPWLLSLALIHAVKIQKRSGDLKKTVLSLAFLSFIFVIFAAFITRSGILQNSVHTFTDPGAAVYKILFLTLLLSIIFPFVLLISRLKAIVANKKFNFPPSSREFFISVGVAIILISALIILYGTLIPIFDKNINIQADFYNTANIPVVIALLIIVPVSLYLNWGKSNYKKVIKKIAIPALSSLVVTVAAVVCGLSSILHMIIVFLAVLTIIVNGILIIKRLKRRKYRVGAFIAHIGFALLFLGIILSGAYQSTKTVQLRLNKDIDFNSYKISYLGKVLNRFNKITDKYNLKLKITDKSGNIQTAVASIYLQDNSIYRIPLILSFLQSDVYIAPLMLDSVLNVPNAAISKGDNVKIPDLDNASVKFINFTMPNDTSSRLGAKIEFNLNNTIVQDTIYSNIDMNTLNGVPEWKTIPMSDIKIGFLRILIDHSENEYNPNAKMLIAFARDKDFPIRSDEVLLSEISYKPYINLVWFSTFLIIMGTLLSIKRNKK